MSETVFNATLRALEAVVERAEREPSIASCRADLSGWTAGQHLEHVSRANRMMAMAVKSILVGAPDVDPDAASSEMARGMLESGEIPRGVASAPDGTEPEPESSAEEVAELAARARADFRRLAAMEDTIRTIEGTTSHPILGPFTAQEWVRFAGVHTRHHLEIVDDILAAGG